MDLGAAIIWAIIVILGAIIVQYLFNPYFHRLGISKKEKIEENNEKTEVDQKREEEFYREIWTAKKKKRNL